MRPAASAAIRRPRGSGYPVRPATECQARRNRLRGRPGASVGEFGGGYAGPTRREGSGRSARLSSRAARQSAAGGAPAGRATIRVRRSLEAPLDPRCRRRIPARPSGSIRFIDLQPIRFRLSSQVVFACIIHGSIRESSRDDVRARRPRTRQLRRSGARDRGHPARTFAAGAAPAGKRDRRALLPLRPWR